MYTMFFFSMLQVIQCTTVRSSLFRLFVPPTCQFNLYPSLVSQHFIPSYKINDIFLVKTGQTFEVYHISRISQTDDSDNV